MDKLKHSGYGCGGIIRDNYMNIIMAYIGSLKKCYVIYVKLFGSLHGLKLCLSLCITNILIEVDASYSIYYVKDSYVRIYKLDLFPLIREIK